VGGVRGEEDRKDEGEKKRGYGKMVMRGKKGKKGEGKNKKMSGRKGKGKKGVDGRN